VRDNDLLIYGLLFLAIIGFNLFKQFLAARAEQRVRQQQAAAAQGMPQPDPEADPFTLTESDWGRPPEAEPVPELRPVLALARKTESARPQSGPATGTIRTPKPSEPRRVRHRLFQHRRALREGIVMMTVLGPCRALQPYDQDHS
jgi:hypothetical protein